MGTMVQFAKVQKPDIRVTKRCTQEAFDTQLDLEKMLGAAVVEQARHFSGFAPGLLRLGKAAFASHCPTLVPESAMHDAAHIYRIAELFAATIVLGRVRVRKEVGLPVSQPEFAEVLRGVGIDDAIDYLKSLPIATADEWRRITQSTQPQAFTASGVENKAALDALRNLVVLGLREGWSEAYFEVQATELLRKFETAAGALRTLWNTTTANAMAKGREEELSKPEVIRIVPYRMYDAILDFHTRPNHRALDGGVAPADWDGWAIYAPPNGFNCRCTLVGLTQTRASSFLVGSGFDLTKGVPLGAGPDIGFGKAA